MHIRWFYELNCILLTSAGPSDSMCLQMQIRYVLLTKLQPARLIGAEYLRTAAGLIRAMKNHYLQTLFSCKLCENRVRLLG